MALTSAEIQAELAVLYERRKASAGVKASTFADQTVVFDAEGLDKRIAMLEQQLTSLTRGSTSRFAATSKGV